MFGATPELLLKAAGLDKEKLQEISDGVTSNIEGVAISLKNVDLRLKALLNHFDIADPCGIISHNIIEDNHDN